MSLKRLFDFLSAAAGLMLLFPLMFFIALFVRFSIGSPIFFRQVRPGFRGKPFMLVKFRTMSNERDESGALKPDSLRLTKLGAWLRATSLDELPELWNVILGEMSLVGPRPLLMSYLPLYSPRQARRHEVHPGITGWVQVNGRNALSWEEKFELDVWYVENRSFLLDLKILFLTVGSVLGRRGISARGEATMPAFTGSPADCSKRAGGAT